MGEFRFGAEESGSTKGDEAVVNDPVIEQDGDRMTVTVTPDQAEAVRKMLASKGDDKDSDDNETKPEWLGDFESPEEMAKAYRELRAKMSGKKGEKPTEEETVEETADQQGVDLDKYREEWNTNGKLSDASYAELQAKGFTRDIVDNYIAGKIATVEKATSQLYDSVGGAEAYQDLIEWGKVNLPSHSQQAYDRLIDSGNFEAAELALRGFMQQYVEANGTDPKSVNAASQAGRTGVQPFANKSDMVAAINDRRYKNGDKNYIAEVERRILASRF